MGGLADWVPLRSVEGLIDTLNAAASMEADGAARAEFLLSRLQVLLGRPTARCGVWVLEGLSHEPSPRIVGRAMVRPAGDESPPLDVSVAQRALADAMPVHGPQIKRAVSLVRTPVTVVMSDAGGEGWFERVLARPYLSGSGYADCMTSAWAASPERAVYLLCLRREGERPFDSGDVTTMSLVARAVAPVLDRDMFRHPRHVADAGLHEAIGQLSPRDREVLLLLLTGDTEKQIARAMGRSVNTVHTFVRRVYKLFEVSSRGELMALFVDRAVVAAIHRAADDAGARDGDDAGAGPTFSV